MWGKLLSLGKADLPMEQGRGAETADKGIEMTHAFFLFVCFFVFPKNKNIQPNYSFLEGLSQFL